MKARALAFVFLGFGILAVNMPAHAQTQNPPPKKDTPKPKAKRVWTEEDMAGLRKPHDDYMDQKQAEADKAAAAAAAAAAAKDKPGASAAGAATPPKEGTTTPVADKSLTVVERDPIEELEEQLSVKEEFVANERGLMEGLKRQISEATDRTTQMDLEKQLTEKQQKVYATDEEIKTINAKLVDLRSKKAATPKAAPKAPETNPIPPALP